MFRKMLNFMAVTDKEGNLSISNILLLGVGMKILLLPYLSIPEMTTFLALVANYSHKRYAEAKFNETKKTNADEQVESLKLQLQELNTSWVNDFVELRTLSNEANVNSKKALLKVGLGGKTES